MFLTMTQIENAANELLDGFVSSEFSLSSFSDAVADRLNADEKSRARVIREIELYFISRGDMFLSGDRCFPKAAFFRDSVFRVVPTPFEVEKNILLAGGRFAPFCGPDIFADEYQANAPVLSMTLRFADLAGAFLLLGRAGLIDYLTAESDENYEVLRSARNIENRMMHISAFDMTEFYREHKFESGDSILVTVLDWDECRFRFDFLSAADAAPKADRDRFLTHFEQALLSVCDSEHDSLELPEQISLAWFTAFEQGHDLRHDPAFSLDDYPSSMCEIAIRRDGPEWSFVPADDVDVPGGSSAIHESGKCSCSHDHAHEHEHSEEDLTPAETDIKPEQFSASSGTLDSLDAILAERNAPLSTIELNALAQDSLSNGVEKFEDFLERAKSMLGITFADDAQETAFLNFLEDDWEVSRELFNPSFDAEKSPLRSRLLDLCEQRIDLSLRLLERFHDKVPREIAHPLAELHRDIGETLSFLSLDSPLPEGADREQLDLRIEDLEDAWDDLSERISSALGQD